MRFRVGTKVMHPRLGAGRVVGTEQREWVEGYENYYVVHIPARDIIVRVPIERLEEIGIRRVMDKSVVSDVLKTLSRKPRRLPDDSDKRCRRIQKKVESARPLQLAEVVRDLSLHQRVAKTGSRDAKFLERARSCLASELAVATSSDLADAEKRIDELVGIALAKALPEEQSAH